LATRRSRETRRLRSRRPGSGVKVRVELDCTEQQPRDQAHQPGAALRTGLLVRPLGTATREEVGCRTFHPLGVMTAHPTTSSCRRRGGGVDSTGRPSTKRRGRLLRVDREPGRDDGHRTLRPANRECRSTVVCAVMAGAALAHRLVTGPVHHRPLLAGLTIARHRCAAVSSTGSSQILTFIIRHASAPVAILRLSLCGPFVPSSALIAARPESSRQGDARRPLSKQDRGEWDAPEAMRLCSPCAW
jgi:hypothetical protein